MMYLDQLRASKNIWWIVRKLFRFMNIMMMQTKCKLNNAELFLKLFYI